MTVAVRAARLIYIETLNAIAIDRQDFKPVSEYLEGMFLARQWPFQHDALRQYVFDLSSPWGRDGPFGETRPFEVWRKCKGRFRHVLLQYQGVLYKIDVCDKRNRLYTVDELTMIVAELLERDVRDASVTSRIPALTTDRR